MEAGLLVLAAAVVVAALLVSRRVGSGTADRDAARSGAQAEAARTLQARLDQMASSVAQLVGTFEERRSLEEAATGAVGRIERLVAGSWSKGRVGENLLEAVLGEFPPEMVQRDFTLAGRVCEFGLVLGDGKLLPIDSKWPGSAEALALEGETDPGQRESLRRQVDKAACSHLREVAGYIDTALTAPLAVMAVPDSVYVCCRRAHRLAKDLRVLVVSYSLAVPVLMTVWNLYATFARDVDQSQMLARIHEVSCCLQELGERIEGQLSRGLKMATNAAGDMRALVSTARMSLDALVTPVPDEVEPR